MTDTNSSSWCASGSPNTYKIIGALFKPTYCRQARPQHLAAISFIAHRQLLAVTELSSDVQPAYVFPISREQSFALPILLWGTEPAAFAADPIKQESKAKPLFSRIYFTKDETWSQLSPFQLQWLSSRERTPQWQVIVCPGNNEGQTLASEHSAQGQQCHSKECPTKDTRLPSPCQKTPWRPPTGTQDRLL